MKKVIPAVAGLLFAGGIADAQVMITGIVDGTLNGIHQPTYVELKNYTNTDLTPGELANIGFYRENDGGTSFSSHMLDDWLLLSPLKAGEFLVVNGDQAQFDSVYPSPPANVTVVEEAFISMNGDDSIHIFIDVNTNGVFNDGVDTIIDSFGVRGVDGNGEAWEYLDSYAVRLNGPVTSTWTAGQWSLGGVDALEGATAGDHATAVPLGVNGSLPVEVDTFGVE